MANPYSLTGPIGEVVKLLWVPICKQISYICNLKENIKKFQIEKEKLSAVHEDVKERVQREEAERNVKCTKEVANWLRRVEEFEGQAVRVLQEGRDREQTTCICRWSPGNCWSTYKLGKEVCQMLDDVEQLQSQREFNVFMSPLPPPVGRVLSIEQPVGLDAMFSKVWKCLIEEQNVGMIGLYGMGGSGKTTLMKMINNKLSREAHGFDIVIWVVASKLINIETIQDSIRKILPISDDDWKGGSQFEKSTKLKGVLLKKKFVLLIDDIWEALDLSEVGVPHPNIQNKSKIVFTTRSEHVCGQMAPPQYCFKVNCLTTKEAFELFELKVSREILNSHPDILTTAKDMVEECEGLPLALVTVGRAMAGRKNPRSWQHSLEMLRNNPSKFSGMDKVFHLLEFSYNSLDDTTHQCCFLYCCIFPEDYKIPKDDLINLWIGEGLLGKINDACKARNEGENIIESLKLACLLEDGGDDWSIKMHDVIRDMATWIACGKGKKNDRILVVENQWEFSRIMFSSWKKAERIGVFGLQIRDIGDTPDVNLELKTLIVRGTMVRRLPAGFFSSMKALIVLNLASNYDMEELPEEIGELTNLQHLDLSNMRIKELPHELKKLTHLRCLILDGLPELAKISTMLISSLSMLNLFSLWIFNYGYTSMICEIERGLIESLGCAEQLSDVSIRVSAPDCILTLLNHPGLRRRLRRVDIHNCRDLMDIKIKHSSSSDSFLHLEELIIHSCTGLVKMEIMCETQELPDHPMFSSLRHVTIVDCDAFTDLSWLMQAPNLQTLSVRGCKSIGKIVRGKIEEASSLFSSLISLELENLPNLTRICDQALLFPSLQSIFVRNCWKLRKLPLDSNSAKNTLRSIEAKFEWWDKLKWDDEATKAVFEPKLLRRP